MKIVNVGIYVNDIEKVKAFFEHYFDAKTEAVLNDEPNNYYSYILGLSEGALIELMNKPTLVDGAKDPNRTGIAHININVGSRDRFVSIVDEFKKEGYPIQYETYSPDGSGGEIRAVTIEDIILEVSF
ncbi:MAG: VOC family protein [Lachnospiraceae bacterium]|nr:VOC family protein [Lachnospiraceae bacterium]